MFCLLKNSKEEIKQAYTSKHNSERKDKVTLLMVQMMRNGIIL